MKEIVIYETKYWEVKLSPDQAYLGRCTVKIKRDVSTLSELRKEEWLDFADIVIKMENALKKTFNATMFNWTCLMNNAYLQKSYKPIVHWHFRPRYTKKVKFLGNTFEDKEFGKHYDRKRKEIVSSELLSKIAEEIKKNI
jgi:diadenosine tetraphosphate (Ap4A) HIT family hydrolase